MVSTSEQVPGPGRCTSTMAMGYDDGSLVMVGSFGHSCCCAKLCSELWRIICCHSCVVTFLGLCFVLT